MPLTAVPRFIDDVGMIISSETLSIMRDNIAFVDALSFRVMPCFDNGADNVLIDGLNALTISNTNTTTSAMTIRFRSGGGA